MISTTVTVGTTPTLLVAGSVGTRLIYLHIIGNTTVYLGGETVTTAAGLATEKHTTPIEIQVRAGDSLYGIVASGSVDVRVMRNK